MADCGNNEINNKRKRPFLHLKKSHCRERARGHSFMDIPVRPFSGNLLLQHFNAVFAGGIIIILLLFLWELPVFTSGSLSRDVIGGSVLGTAWGIVWAIINSYIR